MKTKKTLFKTLVSAIAVALVSVGAASVQATNSTAKGKYYTAYNSEDEAVTAAIDLQRRIAGEGDVLLKNQNEALPLNNAARISVFGGRQNNVLGAASNSGGTSSGSGGLGLASALAEYGFKVNPTLEKFYQNNATGIGSETTTFSGQVMTSLNLYNEAAIVMFSREGGEGSDAGRVTSEAVDEDNFPHQALYTKTVKTTKDGVETSTSTTYKHYLMLTNQEEELLNFVKANFNKVVVVINSSNAMEVADLKNDPQISAIINIGRPGGGGLYGLAEILNGTVSPSGSLVDEWMADFTTDPTWYNFGNNNQTGGVNDYYYADGTATGKAGTSTSHDSEGYHGVDYEEGIYLGYKYYETVYAEIAEGNIAYNPAAELGKQLTYNAVSTGKTAANIESANAWWSQAVAYAYGYGLTYTSFSFNIQGVYTKNALGVETALAATGLADKLASTATKAADIKTVYVKVAVKNTGAVAGKKTVQIYATAPYTKGGVEKAAVSLVGFGKTKTLKPGQTEVVSIAVNAQDIASYDYKNLSGVVGADGGYVLEQGQYTLRAMDTSHFDYATDVADNTDAYDEVKFSLDKSVELVQDDYSGNVVSNLFSDATIGSGAYMSADATTAEVLSGTTEAAMHDQKFNSVRTADMMADGTTGMTIISRANMVETFPEAPTVLDHKFKNSVLNYFAYWDQFRASTEYSINQSTNLEDRNSVVREASYDQETDPWYKSSVPTGWTQATGVYDEHHKVQYNRSTLEFAMYVSKAEECPIKFADMIDVDYDDPKWDAFLNQLTYDELCTVVEFGGYCTVDIQSVGKAKHMDTDGPNNLDGTVAWTSEDILAATFNVELAYEEGYIMGNIGLLHGVQGWYGPGADTHRSPFSGRNNEYYSQDGLHAGYIGAAEVQGVQAMGVIPYIKHCLMNDMETDRGTMFVWADEQTIRESGAKQFQIVLQEGQCKAAMTGYARLCGLNNTNNYNLGVKLYQEQWGSNAYFVTDGYIGWRTRTDLDSMVRMGNQMELYTNPFVEYLSGDWVTDSTHANGGYVQLEVNSGKEVDEDGNAVLDEKGNNVIDASKKQYIESATQWYWVRMSAKSILWQVANSAGQFNGYNDLTIADQSFEATVGVSFSGSVALPMESTKSDAPAGGDNAGGNPGGGDFGGGDFGGFSGNTSLAVNDDFPGGDFGGGAPEGGDFPGGAPAGNDQPAANAVTQLTAGSSVVYSATGLPAGLTIDEATGTISGTAKTEGKYDVTVTYRIDGWIEKTSRVTITVAPAFFMNADGDALDQLNVGEEMMAQIESSVLVVGNNWDSVTYAVKSGKLPAGVELAANGQITGTPTEAGTFTVVVGITATKTTVNTKKGTTSVSTQNEEYTITLVVAGAAQAEPTPEVQPTPEKTPEVQPTPEKTPEVTPETVKSGCGAALTTTNYAIVLVLVALCVAFGLAKIVKKENE